MIDIGNALRAEWRLRSIFLHTYPGEASRKRLYLTFR